MNIPRLEVHIMIDALLAQNRLPRAIQDKSAKLILKLKNDPSSPGLNFESIEGARDRHMKSVRVDQAYRTIVYQRGGALIVLWVDKHDDAYRWARNRVVDINPLTSAVQVTDLSLVEVLPPLEAATPKAAPAPAPLFKNTSDNDLIKIGVPEILLPAVRKLTSDEELENAKSGIPADAYDALICLAAGFTVQETIEELERGKGAPVTVDNFAAALKTPESRRTFWLVEDDAELQKMLDEPLKSWRIFLHPTQRKLVERSWNGPVLVRGGAGTGKTVVAMHRARYMADLLLTKNDSSGKVLFTTFTSNLAADVSANLANLCSDAQFKKIEVVHLDGWVTEFMRQQGYNREIVYGEDERKTQAWENAIASYGAGLDLSLDYLRDEWRQVVQANGIADLSAYLHVQRTGRGTRLDRKVKEQVWAVFAAYRDVLDAESLSEPEDAYRDAREMLKSTILLPYRSIVVDEGQDLGAEAFKLVAAMLPSGGAETDSLFIVGDAHQRIYGRKASLSKCNINVKGRSRKLKICYRTSDEIRRWAVSIIKGVAVDDLDESADNLKGYRSLFHGPKPEVVIAESPSAQLDSLIQWVEDCKNEGIQEQDICVLARTNRLVQKTANDLRGKGYKVVVLRRQRADDRTKGGLRLGTMHRSKGLEFAAVAIVYVDDDVIPLKAALEAAADPAIRRDVVDAEKSLLHVAAARAKKNVFVSSSGTPSDLISHLG
jgi:superfamily I DNA/RNA helicase